MHASDVHKTWSYYWFLYDGHAMEIAVRLWLNDTRSLLRRKRKHKFSVTSTLRKVGHARSRATTPSAAADV